MKVAKDKKKILNRKNIRITTRIIIFTLFEIQMSASFILQFYIYMFLNGYQLYEISKSFLISE